MPAILNEPDPIDIAVGARVRMRRKMLKVTQSGLASALGITFQQVQKYERGTNRISASMLVKIARRLDSTVASLVGEDNEVSDALAPRLATAGAMDVLDAFLKIKNEQVRRRVLALMASLAGEETADEADLEMEAPRPSPVVRRGKLPIRRRRLRRA